MLVGGFIGAYIGPMFIPSVTLPSLLVMPELGGPSAEVFQAQDVANQLGMHSQQTLWDNSNINIAMQSGNAFLYGERLFGSSGSVGNSRELNTSQVDRLSINKPLEE